MQIKRVFIIFIAVFLPLFMFLYSGQTIYAAMNSTDALHKENLLAVKPLAVTAGPVIDIWYGDEQQFGQLGNPQEWINILGNVTTDTTEIRSISYTLNAGSAIPLALGDDFRRLAKPGDFNIDIATSDLDSGLNEVVITAVDWADQSTSKTVSVTYTASNVWPLPFTIDWSAVSNIQSVAQVIDGEWQLTGSGLRNHVPDYDRLVGIGDMTWTDYEIVVPVTIHSVDVNGFFGNSAQPGMGVLMRWTGHTDDPVSCGQPKCGWEPNGTIAWWQWDHNGSLEFEDWTANLEFWNTGIETGWTPDLETEYIMKVQVVSMPGQGGNYKIKVWESSNPEPAAWDITYQKDSSDLANGSLLLISHHVDVTYGDVSIYPVNAPVAYDLTTLTSGNGSVSASPNQTSFAAGASVTLTATPNVGHVFSNWSGDVTGTDNPVQLVMTNDMTVTANFVADSNKTLTVGTVGNGSVTKNPNQADYVSGSTVTVTAVPASGWLFNGWSGDVASAANPLAVVMNTNKNITATFVEESASAYTLTINKIGNGTLAPNPAQVTYTSGQVVTLTAAADSGWAFDSWGGALSGTTNPQSLLMDSNKEITGTFIADTGAPVISNVVVYPLPTSAIIQWETNEAADSQVNYGTTASYGLGTVSNAEQVVNHAILVTNLSPNTTYHYQIISKNSENVSSSTADATFTTTTDGSGLVSDDFNSGTISNTVWTFVDPVGDGAAWQNGTQLLINVPGDVSHNIWDTGNNSVQLMQSANNADFDVEIKIDSGITQKYQMQGILVKEDSANFLRLEYYSEGVNTHVFAASFTAGFPTIIDDLPLPGWNAPMYMRVNHVDDLWFLWYSANGTDWQLAKSFTRAMTVDQVGVYGANASDLPDAPPEHTAVYDYFMNPASPISPEDPDSSPLLLNTNTVGSGSISVNPNKASYAYGEMVTLTAVAGLGYSFNSWSGDATGSSNPVVITMDTDKDVTATFLDNSIPTYMLTKTVVGSGSITVQPDKSSYQSGEVVTVTATGNPGWDFTGWSGSLSGTTNPTTLTMNSNKSITATFAQDNVAPVISNVQVLTTSKQAIITWNTDEPANSSVDYGTTASYGSNVSKSPYVLTHSVTITGLTASTTYHFRITSADENANSSSTADATFTTDEASLSGIVSDDFNTFTISNTVWTFVDPVGGGSASQNGTQLLINVPAGTSHNIWDQGNKGVRLMQSVTDADFEVEVKFESNVTQQFQVQGIIVEEDADNFLRFDFFYGDGAVHFFGGSIAGGAPSQLFDVNLGATYPQPMYMLVNRTGSNWTVSYSNDGSIWIPAYASSLASPITMTGIGVFAANHDLSTPGTSPAHTAVVDYFFNTDEPIDPEDPINYQYTLDTNVVGNGSITVNPFKLTYGFNEVVTVTAVAQSGWLFNGWSGDISGSTAAKTITMNSNKSITATFIQDTVPTYTLTIGKVGNGNVTVTPEKASYTAGEVVTVSAVPAAGWQFNNWSGDSSSTNSSIQITMNANKNLTANFTVQTYSVSTAVSGQGTVTVYPVQANYTYGQVITVTAVPAAGWEFSYWSGGSFGNTNPKQIVVTGNISITANFIEEQNYIFLPMIIKP